MHFYFNICSCDHEVTGKPCKQKLLISLQNHSRVVIVAKNATLFPVSQIHDSALHLFLSIWSSYSDMFKPLFPPQLLLLFCTLVFSIFLFFAAVVYPNVSSSYNLIKKTHTKVSPTPTAGRYMLPVVALDDFVSTIVNQWRTLRQWLFMIRAGG